MVHILLGFGISLGLCNGFHRACLSLLSHLVDAGLGVESSLSCVGDVGGVGVDEHNAKEVVDNPGTTTGT